MSDEPTVLSITPEAQRRVTAMIASWDARRAVLQSERYANYRACDHEANDAAVNKILDLDASVIHGLTSMLRLGGVVMADHQDPPSLIVSTPHLTYGVSVLRQLGMHWSVDS